MGSGKKSPANKAPASIAPASKQSVPVVVRPATGGGWVVEEGVV